MKRPSTSCPPRLWLPCRSPGHRPPGPAAFPSPRSSCPGGRSGRRRSAPSPRPTGVTQMFAIRRTGLLTAPPPSPRSFASAGSFPLLPADPPGPRGRGRRPPAGHEPSRRARDPPVSVLTQSAAPKRRPSLLSRKRVCVASRSRRLLSCSAPPTADQPPPGACLGVAPRRLCPACNRAPSTPQSYPDQLGSSRPARGNGPPARPPPPGAARSATASARRPGPATARPPVAPPGRSARPDD